MSERDLRVAELAFAGAAVLLALLGWLDTGGWAALGLVPR